MNINVITAIRNSCFVAKDEGVMIIPMKRLFAIIGKEYNTEDHKLTNEEIHTVINDLVKLQYLGFKRYETGAIRFYPTKKVQDEARTPDTMVPYEITNKFGVKLIPEILKYSFEATKGESAGKIIITMKNLFKVIGRVYNSENIRLTNGEIKGVINSLCKLQYLCVKKYDSGAMIFFPTKKVAEFVNPAPAVSNEEQPIAPVPVEAQVLTDEEPAPF